MKKCLAVLVTLTMILSFGVSAYASGLTDVAGTAYETSVSSLVEKGIISGYEEDNTYRPENTISRAEACVVVVRALGAAAEEIAAAPDNGFNDLGEYPWAVNYINYAASKGIVSGYDAETFGPAGDVTYVEMAAMLLNALGVTAEELTGAWPENYSTKAVEKGLFANTVTGDGWSYGDNATRGNVAIMTYTVADEVALAGGSASGDGSQAEDPDNEAGGESPDENADASGEEGSGEGADDENTDDENAEDKGTDAE